VTLILVLAGGAIGAPARYFTNRVVQTKRDSVFPLGTLIVNVVGSFVLGVIVGAHASPTVMAVAGTGLCGALTTYSTFGYETHRLLQNRALLLASANIVVSLGAGLAAAALGYAIGGGFS